MNDIHFDSNDREKMIIETANKRCEISPYLSMADTIYVKTMMKDTKEKNYLEIVAAIISKHTEGVFNKEEIISLGDDIINKYIVLCVNSDSVLKGYFDEICLDNLCERFIQSILKYADYFSQHNLSLYASSISSVQNQLSDVTKNILPNMETVIEAARVSSSIVKETQEIWKKCFEPIVDTLKTLYDYSAVFAKISSSILRIVKDFNVPSISKAEKKRLIASYTQWGMYGWTLPPKAKISLFSNPPTDIKAATTLLASYTTKDKMNELFILLTKMKRIKKSDIQEAIECFNERHYKSCAMILFSIMDARLIRLQDKAKEGEMRPSGRQAAEILFSKIKPKSLDEDVFFTLLNHMNIITALENVFKSGKDFKEQPTIINRNFLDHGMLHRRVSRRDCCMLFLLLYNFSQYLNDYIDGEP